MLNMEQYSFHFVNAPNFTNRFPETPGEINLVWSRYYLYKNQNLQLNRIAILQKHAY